MNSGNLFEKAREIIEKNNQYKLEAYAFLLSGLEYTVKKLDKTRHVTGQELSEGLRLYALDQFGPMAKTVLEHWGIHGTQDFGTIVYLLIDSGLMRKNETDSLNDFKDVFDFDSAFNVTYEI